MKSSILRHKERDSRNGIAQAAVAHLPIWGTSYCRGPERGSRDAPAAGLLVGGAPGGAGGAPLRVSLRRKLFVGESICEAEAEDAASRRNTESAESAGRAGSAGSAFVPSGRSCEPGGGG